MKNSNWFVIPQPKLNATMRLFCFPFAGGNASSFISWAKGLNEDVELVAIQPPGRSNRIADKAYTDTAELVMDLANEIEPLLDMPYVVFGHSLGSQVAFELIHELKARALKLPRHFIASARQAPCVKRKEVLIHLLPDTEFIQEIRLLEGTPESVINNDELMEMLLPVLKADFEMARTYTYQEKPNLDCNLTVFGGLTDRIARSHDLNQWQKHFNQKMTRKMFIGGHFFLEEEYLILKNINQILNLEINQPEALIV
ncbi:MULTISPECIES: thioesterase II family protein [unclassified Pseudoalteromonas]|uniref:thioesterase II family protein n=1 Tax=unclassified Pseudoalteromonas TaxID=194690 RepID=UPI0005A95D40|nr:MULTISPECIES: thioesterase domain-containing protein [unclassified Pseudoalteromonas]